MAKAIFEHDAEIPLKGGNVNSTVVRIKDTVRRATSYHSPSVHRLLEHLEATGFTQSPRFQGIDAQGREILSYLPGQTNIPETLWQDQDALVAAVLMLRRYHDAATSFVTSPDDNWAFTYAPSNRNDVIGHNDFAPYNMVFHNGQPIGIFDFDLAGPAPRLRDLAYLAYWFAPLSFASQDMKPHAMAEIENGSPRLRLICKTYEMDDDADLLHMVSEVLVHMGSEIAAIPMIGRAAATKLREGGHFDHWQKEAQALQKMRPRLSENLKQDP